jgi:hypothetical protein
VNNTGELFDLLVSFKISNNTFLKCQKHVVTSAPSAISISIYKLDNGNVVICVKPSVWTIIKWIVSEDESNMTVSRAAALPSGTSGEITDV